MTLGKMLRTAGRTTLISAPVILATAISTTAGSAQAEDWPQYRGPERSGHSSEGELLDSWSEAGPAEVWHRAIGGGFSAMSIADGRLFTMQAIDLEESVLAVDLADGSTIWRTYVGETNPEFFPSTGPRSTPTVVGDRLFTVSSKSRLMAMSAKNGAILWERDLTEYGPTPRFGYSVSPLVDGDNVVVSVGDRDKQPGIVSFDRESGEVLWQAGDGPAGYSSPIALDLGGVRQYVFATPTAIIGLSPTGESLWSHDTGPKAALPMPVFAAPDKIFVSTADDGFGGLMIRVTHENGVFRTEELWKERLMRNHFNTSVIVDGHIYGFDNATMRCLDAETGEKKWAKRGFGKGSLVAAGDLLYVLSDNGTLALVHADANEYREAGRIEVMEGRSWTSPSLADGRIYVRDDDELVSLDLRASGTAVAEGAATDPVAGDSATGDLAMVSSGPDGISLDEIVARHIEARGGAERWSQIDGLEMSGVYAAFSEESDFTLVRLRGDRYRLDFDMLGGPAVRARDENTAWWQHALLQAEPAPVGDHPYKPQLERESMFGPLLLDWADKGLEVELVGQSEINGVTTIDLKVTFPGGQEETWHLDAQSYLEVAVDSTILDYTQFADPTAQRTFYSDFREVDGLVIPYRVDSEFGARLEEMRVEQVTVDPSVDAGRLQAPPAPAPTSAAESG